MADSASLASSSDDLQFNTVESSANDDTQGAAAERTCIGCHQPITSTYYALGEKLVCPTCRERVNTRPQGSGVVRFLKATVFGIGAAILGAVIWYVVRSAAHIESGLIAILVGFLVGKAVFIGSNNYGGLGYQLLAVLLTYCGIAGNYFPDAYEGTLNAAREQHQQAVAEQANAPAEAHNDRLAERDPTESPIVMALVIVFSIGISLAAPFLMGVENIIGILIIGFALWEAWKFNARRVLPITGPYQMGAAPAV